ncbi:MAG: lipopolysaccharide biosynthesis protein [Elusimicrobiota bacterium]
MEQKSGGRAVRFAKNIVWSVSGQICVVILGFFLTPYVIHKIGVRDYGLYIILNAVASYLMVLSFSAAPAASKFLSEFAASGDLGKLRGVAYQSFVFQTAGPIAGSLLVGLEPRFFIVRVFHVSGSMIAPGIFALRCAAAACVAVSLITWSSAILVGLQSFKRQSIIYVLQHGFMIMGAAAAAAAGLGIWGIAGWYAALNAGVCALALVLAWGMIKPYWRHDAASGKEGLGIWAFGSYSFSLWLGQIAWIVTYQFDKIFLARGTSIAGLTLYSVPAGFLQRLQFVPAAVSVVLMPVISEVGASGTSRDLGRLYLKTVRGLLWTVLPVYIIFFALMPQFLCLWLGGDFGSVSVWPARLLVLAQIILLLSYVPNAVATGGGKPLYASLATWGQALVSVIAWKVFIPRYGLLGAAAGSLLAQLVPDFIYLRTVHRRILSLSWEKYFTEGVHAPFVCGLFLAAILLAVHSRITTWPLFAATGFLGYILFLGCGYLILGDEDRQTLESLRRHAIAWIRS